MEIKWHTIKKDWAKEDIKGEIKRHVETNENENMTFQNFWDAAKVVKKGNFISIQPYLKKQEKYQVDNLVLHLKELEKEERKQSKVSRRKETIKIRAELNREQKDYTEK